MAGTPRFTAIYRDHTGTVLDEILVGVFLACDRAKVLLVKSAIFFEDGVCSMTSYFF
jgi:hypothetical protein